MPAPPSPEPTDRDIIERIRRRDEVGLRWLLNKCSRAARRMLKRKYPWLGYSDTEAAINQAALSMWRNGQSFNEGKGTLAAFFVRIVSRKACDIARDQRRWSLKGLITLPGEFEPEDKAPDGKPKVQRNTNGELIKALRQAINGLPPLQQWVVKKDLEAGECADGRQLAEQRGTSPDAIYVARHRGRKALRDKLGDFLGHDEG